jgi:hypothetical protein
VLGGVVMRLAMVDVEEPLLAVQKLTDFSVTISSAEGLSPVNRVPSHKPTHMLSPKQHRSNTLPARHRPQGLQFRDLWDLRETTRGVPFGP